MINVGAMVASLTLDTKKFMVGMQKVTKAVDPLKTRFMVLGRTIKKFTKAIFNLRSAFIVLAATMASRKVLGVFKEFQIALVDMGKVTSRNLQRIRKDVMALAPVIGTSTDLMRGYYQVISAGVKGATKQINTLVVSSKAAIAAHVAQGEVIKGLTAIVDAYEGKVRGAAEAADILFTIERLGKTTVAELIPIIGSLASMSATMKISQDELGGSLAQLTKFIGSTAEAATQLKALYTALITPNEDLNALFKEQGGVLKAIGEIGFIEVLRRMDKATQGNVEALKLLMEGRREALLGFLSLSKQGFVPVIDNISEMTKKTGAADDAFRKWAKTLEATYVIFQSTIGRVMIEMGQELAPMVIKVILRMSEWLEKYQDAIVATTRAMVRLLPKMVKLVAMFTALNVVVGVILLFKGFKAAVLASTAAMIKLNTAMKANLVLIAGLLAYEVGKWLGKWFDGTAKAERVTKEWTGQLKRLKEELNNTKESMRGLSDETEKWLARHEAWTREMGEAPLVPEMDPEEVLARQRKLIDEINELLMDKFDFAEDVLYKEYLENVKVAGMQLTAWEIYTEKLRILDEKRNEEQREEFQKTIEDWREGFEKLGSDIETVSVEQLTGMRSMYEDMRSYGEEYFDVIEQLIKNQAKIYKKQKIDETIVNKWAEAEKAKIHRQHWMNRRDLELQAADTIVDSWMQIFQQLGQKSESAFEAFKRMQQLQAVIDAVRVSLAAYKWGWEYGGPAAPYVSTAMMISAGALAFARVAMIEAQTYKGYAAGGWLDRNPRGGRIDEGGGGRDDVFLGATPGVNHWAARDEFVMNPAASRKYGALLEIMNRGYLFGGGFSLPTPSLPTPSLGGLPGLGGGVGIPRLELGAQFDLPGITDIDPVLRSITGWWEDLTAIPEPEFDPDAFAGILQSIRQMKGETTALEDATYSTRQQFKGWIKQLEEMGASEEQLNQVRSQEADVIAKLTADMQEGFLKPIDDIIEKGTMTDYGYELEELSKWYQEGKKTANELGLSSSTLTEAYKLQKQAIDDRIASFNAQTMEELDLREVQLQGMDDQAEVMRFSIRQNEELANAIEEGATEATIAYMEEIQRMEKAALKAGQELKAVADGIGDLESEISDLESALSGWETALTSVQDQILSMATSMATSPLNAVERLDLIWDAINSFGEISTPEAVSELQGLYSSMLDVAGEAYQRPSVQYAAEYAAALSGLGELEAIAEGFVSEYDLQVQQLEVQRGILEALLGQGSYQMGTRYVPETGLYTLHEGEQVTPAGGQQLVMNLTINESRTPRETGTVVRREMEGFLKSAVGRKMIQQTAIGRG